MLVKELFIFVKLRTLTGRLADEDDPPPPPAPGGENVALTDDDIPVVGSGRMMLLHRIFTDF